MRVKPFNPFVENQCHPWKANWQEVAMCPWLVAFFNMTNCPRPVAVIHLLRPDGLPTANWKHVNVSLESRVGQEHWQLFYCLPLQMWKDSTSIRQVTRLDNRISRRPFSLGWIAEPLRSVVVKTCQFDYTSFASFHTYAKPIAIKIVLRSIMGAINRSSTDY